MYKTKTNWDLFEMAQYPYPKEKRHYTAKAFTELRLREKNGDKNARMYRAMSLLPYLLERRDRWQNSMYGGGRNPFGQCVPEGCFTHIMAKALSANLNGWQRLYVGKGNMDSAPDGWVFVVAYCDYSRISGRNPALSGEWLKKGKVTISF